ncbi:MAG: hemolysin family protein, partial [Acidimicrobiia bacterium]
MFDLARDLPLLLGLVFLLLAAVFLAAAETSIIRISRARVKTLAEHGSRSARRLLGLVQHLPRVLNAVLLTVLLVQIGAATITGQLAERWFGNLGITIASMVLTVLMFVYTEAIPKTFAVQHPDRVALFVAYPVGAIELLLRPLVRVLVWFADLQAPGLGISSSEKGVSEAELRHLAAEAEETGQIASSERDLIERVFRLDERIAEEIMVPRVDIIAVPVEASVEKAVEVALAAGHRRVPVYQDSLDHIIGVARTKDLLTARDRGLASLRELARPPLVVPGSKRVVTLLREMQAADVH